jgi:hypothetical protein
MFDSEVERIDVAPELDVAAPVPPSPAGPGDHQTWVAPRRPATPAPRPALSSLLAAGPALLGLLLYTLGVLEPGPAAIALISPAGLGPCITVLRIHLEQGAARARRATNVVV